VYERRANPNPLTPKEDDWTDKHLKYYIYRMFEIVELRAGWHPSHAVP
jgi:hypothetical protein